MKDKILYNCELPNWYRVLSDKVQGNVGKQDEEINTLFETTKLHYRLSPTHPKLAKAKLALIVMSMPATTVCQVHVQRSLQFLLHHVMGMPADTLTHWLGIRLLPYVLTSTA
nr:hypothetical protein BaRGS_009085 [Batillaria attramentaria]